MSQIKIYHNPECGTSRNTLGLIRNAGLEPEVILYLEKPPTAQELSALIQSAGLTVDQAMRKNVAPYADLKIAEQNLSDDALIKLMVQYPLLINRPFVVTELGIRLARPSEVVLEILPASQQGAFIKEDGEQIINELGQRVK